MLHKYGKWGGDNFQDDDDDGSPLLYWSREVECVDNMDTLSMSQKLGEKFARLEKLHSLTFDCRRSMYVFDRSDRSVNAEKSAEKQRIVGIKQVLFSLLFASGNNTEMGMSRVVCKETSVPSYDEMESTETVFRLANDFEIHVIEKMVEYGDSGDY